MAPVPKKKHTPGRTGRRRGGKTQKLPQFTRCKSCKKLKYPHKICPHCGKR